LAWPPRSQTSNSRPEEVEDDDVPSVEEDRVGATTRSTLQPSVGVVETVSPRWRR
jgi:hypothetical protein